MASGGAEIQLLTYTIDILPSLFNKRKYDEYFLSVSHNPNYP